MLILQGLRFPIPPNLINKNWAVSKPSGKEYSLIKVQVLVTQSCLTLCNLWTVAYQAPLSLEFSRQEYWSGLSCPSPGMFLTQGLNLGLLHCHFPGGSDVKGSACNTGNPYFLDQKNPLEKGMEIHSSILAWRIPWTEESGRL